MKEFKKGEPVIVYAVRTWVSKIYLCSFGSYHYVIGKGSITPHVCADKDIKSYEQQPVCCGNEMYKDHGDTSEYHIESWWECKACGKIINIGQSGK